MALDKNKFIQSKGWKLLYSSSISTYDDIPIASALGTIYTPYSVSITYQQVYFDCTSKTRRVNRVRTLNTQSKTARPIDYQGSENYFNGDNLDTRPSILGDTYGGWNEQHLFGSSQRRFIIRDGKIHCAMNYVLSPGSCQNCADTGNYGRVWVRDSTVSVLEANLPSFDGQNLLLTNSPFGGKCRGSS